MPISATLRVDCRHVPGQRRAFEPGLVVGDGFARRVRTPAEHRCHRKQDGNARAHGLPATGSARRTPVVAPSRSITLSRPTAPERAATVHPPTPLGPPPPGPPWPVTNPPPSPPTRTRAAPG